MKGLRKRFERFCYLHRNVGIPNLMLYFTLGSALVYLFTMISGNWYLYSFLIFDRDAILQGQIWRLFSYPLTYGFGNSSLLLVAITLFCYYSLGRTIETMWGTLKFNLFYFSGILLMDIFCLLFGGRADVYYLNMSLFLSYATLFPDAQFLFFFIIPVKAWIFALIDLALTLFGVIQLSYPVFYFPLNLFPLVALANYFLFFGKDVLNVIPLSWRRKRNKQHKKEQSEPKVVPFPQKQQIPYTHKCVICGRTDISDPQLEFRYCSRCKGYYCYCQEHIDNHAHMD